MVKIETATINKREERIEVPSILSERAVKKIDPGVKIKLKSR